MLNCCTTPFPRQCIRCELPPCRCDKCTLRRSEDKPDQNIQTLCAEIRSENNCDHNEEEGEREAKSKSEQQELENCIENLKNQYLRKGCQSEQKGQHHKMEQSVGKTDQTKGRLFKIPSLLTVFSFDFTPSNLQSVLFDIVGVISFFIMSTAIFWVTIAQYLWYFINIIIDSGRKVQLISLVLFLLLCASITFHAFQGRSKLHHHRPNIQLAKKPPQRLQPKPQNTPTTKQCIHQKCCHHKKIAQQNLKNQQNSNGDNSTATATAKSHQQPEKGSFCNLCGKELKAESNSTSNSQPLISDEEALEMFKRYKLYSVPTEMKTPPSIGNIVEVLTGFFHGITNSIGNTFS